MTLATLIARLPLYARRGRCVEILRAAGLSGYVINEGMACLKKHTLLGSKYAQYQREEFLQAFALTAPASSVKPEI